MILRWTGSQLVPTTEPVTRPDVVDSWLETDGYYSSTLDRHQQRFSQSLPGIDITDFWAAVRIAVPHLGRWFPRIEAHGGQLYLRVRPAPELRTTTVLYLPDYPDPRRCPRIKGPDVQVLAQMREEARSHGADDALLYSPDGFVSEAANSAVGWWEGDALFIPEHLDQLPSVTVAETAELMGTIHRRPIHLEELQTYPVWVGSALHGWTTVTAWVQPDGTVIPAVRTPEPPTTPEMTTTLLRWG